MKHFALCIISAALAFTAGRAQATVNADFAANYSSGWTSGDNGGAGFGAWTIDTIAGAGLATNGIWDSSSAGLNLGNSFGYGAWGEGASIRLDRAFTTALSAGDVFAFDLGLNADAGTGGNKGFELRTSDNRVILAVNQADSDLITINGTTALTNAGTTTMHWTITQTSATQLSVYATGRSGSEATTIIVTNAVASYGASIRFYASNLVNDASAAQRGVYFDNLILSQSGGTGTFTYTVESGATTITGISTNASGSVIVPATLGGYPVVALGRSAFKDATNITSITFASGASVTNIGAMAFQGCTALTLAVLPAGTKSLPVGLFQGCVGLVSVTIPTSVTNIGSMAFANCRSLPSLALPSGLQSLGESVFLNCRKLAAIDFPDNPKSLPGQTCYECRALAAVDFAAGLTNIGYAAFYNCLSLTTLTPPATLGTLAADAFNGCSGLTTLSFSGALTSIGDRAFYACTNLVSLYFDGSVGSLGAAVFGNDPTLTALYFTGSAPTVTDDGDDLFAASSLPTIYALSSSGWSSSLGGATVTAWLPVMSNPVLQSGAFSFTVDWANGYTVRVQAATNLADAAWSDWSTNTISNGYATFSDTSAGSYEQRFYRVVGEQ